MSARPLSGGRFVSISEIRAARRDYTSRIRHSQAAPGHAAAVRSSGHRPTWNKPEGTGGAAWTPAPDDRELNPMSADRRG
jgi:hypothetical protein